MNHDLDRRFLLGGLAGAAGVSALAAMAKGGPLSPPPGPLMGSGRTTAELEPRIPVTSTTCPGNSGSTYIISQPGSYYLTENLAGVSGNVGLTITASSVVLDMMGFAISGGGSAIVFSGSEWLVVRNGVIKNMQSFGILASSSPTVGPSLIENVRVQGCVISGILVNPGSVVRGCHVSSCGNTGIAVNARCLVESCHTAACVLAGVLINGTGSCVRGCVMGDNSGPAIQANSSMCAVIGNVVRSSGSTSGLSRGGIRCVGSANYIAENNLFANPYGIECSGSGNVLVRNTVAGSTVAFELAAGNLHGPIVAPSGATPAVSGGAAVSTMASADPNANFVF